MSPSRPPADSSARLLAAVLSFGWVLPAAIAAGAGLGYLGDRLLGTFPGGTFVGGGLGFAAGLRQLFREASVFFDEKDEP